MIEREDLVVRGRHGLGLERWRFEGETARNQRSHRLSVHFDSIRPNRDVDSARVPEARPRENVLVVRRLDEYLQLDRRAVGGEIVTDHLTDLESAVIDRRADFERPQIARRERELPSPLQRDDGRCLVETDEGVLARVRDYRLESDVVSRQQRVESGNSAQADARADNPELRVVDHQRSGVLVDLDRDFHLAESFGQLHFGHPADDHVLVFDERLAGLDAFGRAEHNRDGRPLAKVALDSNADGDQRRENRDDPDDGYARALPRRDRRLREVFQIRRLSHGESADWRPRPRSAAGRTTAPPASSTRRPP